MLQSGVETTTTTTGTGTFDLAAPTDPLRVGFVSGIGNGGAAFYRCEFAAAGQWEEGWGTVTAGSPDTLTRNVIRSSNSNALVNFSAGTKRIFCSDVSEGARFGAIGTVPTATGTANAIAVAHVPPMRVLRPGMAGRFLASAANSGAVTVAFDGLSAVALNKGDGTTALAAGDIVGGGALVTWVFDGTRLRLLSCVSAFGASLMAAATAAAARSLLGALDLPTSSTRQAFASSVGGDLVLPAGGQYEYLALSKVAATGALTTALASSVDAGGTTVLSGVAGWQHFGYWRKVA